MFISGCDNFFDGLVCWPFTRAGHQANVDCFTIEAFAQAIKLVVDKHGAMATGGIDSYIYRLEA